MDIRKKIKKELIKEESDIAFLKEEKEEEKAKKEKDTIHLPDLTMKIDDLKKFLKETYNIELKEKK